MASALVLESEPESGSESESVWATATATERVTGSEKKWVAECCQPLRRRTRSGGRQGLQRIPLFEGYIYASCPPRSGKFVRQGADIRIKILVKPLIRSGESVGFECKDSYRAPIHR